MALLLVQSYIPSSLTSLSPGLLNENKKSVGIIGTIVYAFYKGYKVTRELRLSGDSKNPLVKYIHNILRKYLNHGYMIRNEFNVKIPWLYLPRRILLMINRDQIIVNYGSYGTVPNQVLDHQIELQRLYEVAPDRFVRITFPGLYEKSRSIVADHIKCQSQNLVFVENTTFGINCALRSLLPGLDDDDIILCINIAYSAILKTISVLAKRFDVKVMQIDIEFPIHAEEEVLQLFEKTLKENEHIKIAVFDHISSATAVKMPINGIGELCRKYEVISIVDAAHAPGQIMLDLDSIPVDIYVGNLHKWYYTPKSCAIMHVNPKLHNLMQPTVVSHGCYGNFHWRFFKQATKNYSAQLTAGYAVQYMEKLGGIKHLHEYITPFVEWAVELYKRDWGTKDLSIPDSMKAPYMRVVYLPTIFSECYGTTAADADRLIIDLIRKYNLSMFVNPVQGKLAVRVSAQIFSLKSEYYYASQCIIEEARILHNRTLKVNNS